MIVAIFPFAAIQQHYAFFVWNIMLRKIKIVVSILAIFLCTKFQQNNAFSQVCNIVLLTIKFKNCYTVLGYFSFRVISNFLYFKLRENHEPFTL